MKLSDRLKEADWKSEKHVPVIDCPDEVKADELFEVSVAVGKDIAHPNTTEHHIRWIALYFDAEGDPNTYQVAHFEFSAHGESAAGANEGPVYTNHQATTAIKLNKPGTLYAMSLCNIHGLWQSSKEIKAG